MPVKIEILTDLGLFITRTAGKMDDQLLAQYQESIYLLPGYKPTLNTLFDARLFSENLISPEGLIRFSSSTPFDASVKRAYIVCDEKAGMLATLFGSTTSAASENFLVTYKLEDACEWLGVAYDVVAASSIFKDDI